MKTTLLLLWSLASFPLQDNCACQGGAAGLGAGAAGAYGSNSYGYSNSGSDMSGGLNGQFGMSDGYGDFNSPCRDCRKKSKGGCNCCKDSTCNMYQHYPYPPDNHGYYYFRPYNYTAVWEHQQWATTIGGDPRNPYSRSMFIPVYEQFENTTYEPDAKPSSTLAVLPHVTKELPDLEKLLKKSDEEMPPMDTVPEPPTPAPTPDPSTNS